MDKTLRRNRFTYANVMSTIAVVLALAGGTAFALSIKSKDIVNGSIKGIDLKAQTLTERQIEKGSLTKESIKLASLTGPEIKERSLPGNLVKKETLKSEHFKTESLKGTVLEQGAVKSKQINSSVTQVLVARIVDLGGAATTNGSISGLSTADSTFGDVSMMLPQTKTFTRMTVDLASALPVGNQRTFTLGSIKGATLTCPILEQTTSCVATGSATFIAGQPIAITVTSTGGGLDPNQDAFVGLSMEL